MYQPTEYQKTAYRLTSSDEDPNTKWIERCPGRDFPTRSRKAATQYMIAKLIVIIEAFEKGSRVKSEHFFTDCSFCAVAGRFYYMSCKTLDCFVKSQCDSRTVQDWTADSDLTLWQTRRVLDMVQRIYKRHFG